MIAKGLRIPDERRRSGADGAGMWPWGNIGYGPGLLCINLNYTLSAAPFILFHSHTRGMLRLSTLISSTCPSASHRSRDQKEPNSGYSAKGERRDRRVVCDYHINSSLKKNRKTPLPEVNEHRRLVTITQQHHYPTSCPKRSRRRKQRQPRISHPSSMAAMIASISSSK